jgi:DNA-binding beta-propeller fold protein YncE
VVVADFVSDDIVVWDATTYECRGVVPVGRYPHGLGLSPDARTLVVSHTGAASVAIVDISGPRVVASVDVEGAPGHVAFDPEGRCAFVACERAETVSVIDVTRGVLVGVVAVGGASDPARAEEQAAPVR